MSTDWKAEISRMAYWKQAIADHDPIGAFPWHLPKVGASSQEIALAEAAAGIVFPSEYKEFLSHADGWKAFSVTTDLFGTVDFVNGRHNEVMERGELLSFLDSLGAKREEVVPIGFSEFDLDVFMIFSPLSRVLPNGVIWFANEEVERHSTFSEFFGAMVHYDALKAQQSTGAGIP